MIHLSAQSVKKCVGCGVEKPRTQQNYEGNRSKCRECRNRDQRIRNAEKQKENPVRFSCTTMAFGAYSRIYADCRKKHKIYQRIKGVKFGFNNAKEMEDHLYDNFYSDIAQILLEGKSPSVDRIDSSKGYTKENIRILDTVTNLMLGVENIKRKVKVTYPDGLTEVFDSVWSCAKYFNTRRECITDWICGKSIPSNGCKFEDYDQTNESEAV